MYRDHYVTDLVNIVLTLF